VVGVVDKHYTSDQPESEQGSESVGESGRFAAPDVQAARLPEGAKEPVESLNPQEEAKAGPSGPPVEKPRLIQEPAAPGEFVSIVTLGSYMQIKVDASYGAIQPGDLLTSSPNPGHAMKASEPETGTIIGKALAGLASGQGTIPVLVTLQ
jgi:hypothetical protein